jgi:hypothetical protein
MSCGRGVALALALGALEVGSCSRVLSVWYTPVWNTANIQRVLSIRTAVIGPLTAARRARAPRDVR